MRTNTWFLLLLLLLLSVLLCVIPLVVVICDFFCTHYALEEFRVFSSEFFSTPKDSLTRLFVLSVFLSVYLPNCLCRATSLLNIVNCVYVCGLLMVNGNNMYSTSRSKRGEKNNNKRIKFLLRLLFFTVFFSLCFVAKAVNISSEAA